MTQTAKSQEPSMEEILASIRRIIADDDAAKTTPPAPEPPKLAPRAFVPPPPEPPAPEIHAESTAPAALDEDDAEEVASDMEDNASDILDLTESMAAPSFSEPAPAPPPM